MWHELGAVAPQTLSSTRTILHWAAQIPSAAGATLLPAAKDSSHTALSWNGEGALVGAPIDGRQAALRFADLRLIVGRAEHEIEGETLARALHWLGEQFGKKLERPMHELPDHPVATGAPFSFSERDRKAAAELARWFDDACVVLDHVARARADASAVRCWPHHFDIATLLALDEKRSIGVGLSPGDASYDEPYFYVTPWPYPEGATLQPLAVGAWHTKGWTGAVLTASKLVSSRQEATAIGFVEGAIDCCLELLRASGS